MSELLPRSIPFSGSESKTKKPPPGIKSQETEGYKSFAVPLFFMIAHTLYGYEQPAVLYPARVTVG